MPGTVAVLPIPIAADMCRFHHFALSTLALAMLAACAAPETAGPGPAAPAGKAPAPVAAVSTAKRAQVNLASASASLVSGRLVLVPVAGGGVHVTGQVGGLQPGSEHGFHIHEKGDCSAADATSAGGHFNPFAQPHGRAGSGQHHAGDIDNLHADAAGTANVDAHLQGVTLGGGAANDIAGRGFIVHAVPDDYVSQPTGNAGARVACGVITVIE